MNALSALLVSAALIAFSSVLLAGAAALFSAKQAVLLQNGISARAAWLCVLADSLSRSPDTLLAYAPPQVAAECAVPMSWSDVWVVAPGN